MRERDERQNAYLLSGLSPSFRKAWLGSHKFPENDQHYLVRSSTRSAAALLAVGARQANWHIEKLRNGLPSQRSKYGMAWVKSSAFDDGYCRIHFRGHRSGIRRRQELRREPRELNFARLQVSHFSGKLS